MLYVALDYSVLCFELYSSRSVIKTGKELHNDSHWPFPTILLVSAYYHSITNLDPLFASLVNQVVSFSQCREVFTSPSFP